MQPEDVTSILEASLPECQFTVQSDGSHYSVIAVGEVFQGLSRVRKQQLIYEALNEKIASGEIHAVQIRAFTPEEWAAR